ncbi:LEF-12 [Parapoynx stagnalis nucleopolyhedrovirus]|uniref:LEF-12 n=1 Tax=Parapoynx stagnalis nucleopolyhedrovirus TaxID=2993413 RepID=A0A9E7Y715_9ABAC|nr:LEF-12 [Parapoynx stagnalis nucleopolyhedrovirus]
MLECMDSKIINKEEFKRRVYYVADIMKMMKRTMNFMKDNHQCTQIEVDSLCVSDDTAAWICGQVLECNFVSFRMYINKFTHPNTILDYFKFEESLIQRMSHDGERFTYLNYNLFKNVVALKLTIYTKHMNMYADGLPYFITKFTEQDCENVNLYFRQSIAQELILNPFEYLIENAIENLPFNDNNQILQSHVRGRNGRFKI